MNLHVEAFSGSFCLKHTKVSTLVSALFLTVRHTASGNGVLDQMVVFVKYDLVNRFFFFTVRFLRVVHFVSASSRTQTFYQIVIVYNQEKNFMLV